MAKVHFYEEFDPARWEELLCEEMRACLAIVLAEGNAITRLGGENIKAPELTAVLRRPPDETAMAQLRAEAARLGCVNVVADGAGCTQHYTGLDWSEPERPKADWKARLRARLGLSPDPHAAAMRALEHDDRPLREAYARVARTTVADLRDRLAEPGDHDRLAWPSFADYRAMVLNTQRASRPADRHPLWERDGARAYRMNGLDFAAIVVREQDGLIREVEFVLPGEEPGHGHAVRIA